MATAERSSSTPEALPVLRELRARIRRYVVLEGSALVLVVLGVAFCLSLAIDYGLEQSAGVRRAAFLMVSIIGFRLADAEVFSTWFRRSLLLADEFYRRETDLRVYILADPGDRVVEFKNGVYKHPRGGDLTFLAEVTEGKKVPDKVQFSYRNVAARGGGGDYMTK